eukprot:TRINITY_DN5407_c0_g1_i1.p1 TRINITY_DN5407_c0_g1~~TRINITY_DN5407_c0_g1_i1.p1  ORF type:complete len:356 (+),score=98.87 TRINITY_DN5407_c0_g1_i1:194-1261(+)
MVSNHHLISSDDGNHRRAPDYTTEEAPEGLKHLEFDHHLHISTESEVYWGKDVVRGQVVYFHKDSIEVKKFEVKFKCTIRVRWSKGKNDFHDVNQVLYFKNTDFITEKTTLEGGYHVFPFVFALDQFVAGSMEYKVFADYGGTVIWNLKAKVDRSGLHFNLKKTKAIKVIGDPLPLKSSPIKAEETNPKTGFGSVPVIASVQVESSQIIDHRLNVMIRIENVSDSELSGYKVKVKREITLKDPKYGTSYFATYKMPHDVAQFVSKEKINPKDIVENVILLEIPLEEIPDFESPLMDVVHFVYFRVLKPALRSDLRLTIDMNLAPLPRPNKPEVPVGAPPSQVPVGYAGKMDIDLM